MILCQCKIRQLPHVPGAVRSDEVEIVFGECHGGTGIISSPVEAAPVAPVEVHHAEPKKEKKPKTIVTASPQFPINLYRTGELAITEYSRDVMVRRRINEFDWKTDTFLKDELSIIAHVWSNAHKSE